MPKVIEIRWHGRGGQGAKTAAELLAEAAGAADKYIQGFPEYGPERMGAPVVAFNRISDEPIKLHCHVTNPDVVLVLDSTLVGKIGVTDGLREDGILLINTNKSPQDMRNLLGSIGKVFTVDATGIALETIGRAIPNTPMLGAFIRVTSLLDLNFFIAHTKEELKKKFKGKGQIIEGNLEAIKRAYQEVEGE